jgi:WD repeat and SOF domain-containing protein 1
VWLKKLKFTLQEERKLKFNETIKKRYAHMPEIKRIARDKKIPNSIKKANSIKHEQNQSERRKQENRKRHSHQEDVAMEPERKRAVIKEYD